MAYPGGLHIIFRGKVSRKQAHGPCRRFDVALAEVLGQEKPLRGFEVPAKQKKADLAARVAPCYGNVQQRFGEREMLLALFMVKQGGLVESLLLARAEDSHSGHGCSSWVLFQKPSFWECLGAHPETQALAFKWRSFSLF
jgi:hypothetical protein